MTVNEVDAYIAKFDRAQQKALNALRDAILQCVPDAEQVISYGMPGFRVRGKVVAGMAGYENFISCYPHSGSVIEQVPAASRFERTPGALHFALNKPIPRSLVKQLIDVKMAMTFKGPTDVWVEHGLAAPARRALAGAGIYGLQELRKAELSDIAELHGIGPKALKVLTELKAGE